MDALWRWMRNLVHRCVYASAPMLRENEWSLEGLQLNGVELDLHFDVLLAYKAMVEKGQRRLAGLKSRPLPLLMMAELQILY